MAVKLLINGISGAGKTDLLRTLDKDTFVVSRDAKEFALELPHMLVDTFYDMATLIYGSDQHTEQGVVRIPGIVDKMEAYKERFGDYPATVAIDSVSQIFMDVIDKASQKPNVYGSQGSEIIKEMSLLTSFIHESLELNGINVILINHVIEEKIEGKKTGAYEAFGSGKFLAKGGFYATTNESITITVEGNYRAVYTRGADKQARTSLVDIPDKMWVPNTIHPDKSRKLKEDEHFFSLREHMQLLLDKQSKSKQFQL
jgi:hypothetical protein